jgi:hypothetical protein
MMFRRPLRFMCFLLCLVSVLRAQTPAQSSSAKPANRPSADATLDPGAVINNVYRNKMLGLAYKIPEGWVLRTDEMNTADEEKNPDPAKSAEAGSKVLLAAFSRPPLAKGEDVNSSIVISAQSAAAFPGLKDVAQYFPLVVEAAKAQGFTEDEEPYEFAMGTKTLGRADFHRDKGTRVVHQSTLAVLSHGYAISIAITGGTEDEIEELIDAINFPTSGK